MALNVFLSGIMISMLEWPAMLPWLSLAAPVLLIWIFFGMRSSKQYKLPPGPPGWPIVGNIFDLIDPKGKKLPHQITAELADVYGPIMMLKMGKQNMVFISSPEMALEILKKQDHLFADRPSSGVKKYMTYGDYHLTLGQQGEYRNILRKVIVTEMLNPKKLQSFEKIRMEEVDLATRQAFDASLKKEVLNLRDLVNELTLNVVTRFGFSRKFFGKDAQAGDEGKQWRQIIPRTAELFTHILVEDMFPSLKWLDDLTGTKKLMQETHSRLDFLLQKLIDDHLKYTDTLSDKELEEHGGRDMMDVMLLMKRKKETAHHINDRAIKALSLDTINAGSETSAMTMEWVFSEILKNPEVMKKAQAEVDAVVGKERFVLESDHSRLPYLAAVIKETFRLHEPLPWLLPRTSHVDGKVGGYDIPAESTIFIQVHKMSRDNSLWKNAQTFDPDRFFSVECANIDVKGSHPQLLPFGAGRRICPGITMAHFIIQTTIARLIQSFDWALPNGMKPQDLDMTETLGVTASKKIPLKAIPTPRLPLHLYQQTRSY